MVQRLDCVCSVCRCPPRDGDWLKLPVNRRHSAPAGPGIGNAFDASSQWKAVAAIEAGRLKDEITPIVIPQCRGDSLRVEVDEQSLAGTTIESLARLKPALRKNSSITLEMYPVSTTAPLQRC